MSRHGRDQVTGKSGVARQKEKSRSKGVGRDSVRLIDQTEVRWVGHARNRPVGRSGTQPAWESLEGKRLYKLRVLPCI